MDDNVKLKTIELEMSFLIVFFFSLNKYKNPDFLFKGNKQKKLGINNKNVFIKVRTMSLPPILETKKV